MLREATVQVRPSFTASLESPCVDTLFAVREQKTFARKFVRPSQKEPAIAGGAVTDSGLRLPVPSPSVQTSDGLLDTLTRAPAVPTAVQVRKPTCVRFQPPATLVVPEN